MDIGTFKELFQLVEQDFKEDYKIQVAYFAWSMTSWVYLDILGQIKLIENRFSARLRREKFVSWS